MFNFLEEVIWGKKCEICGYDLDFSEDILCQDCEEKFDNKLRVKSMKGIQVLFAYTGMVRSLLLRGKYKFNKRLWQVWEKWMKCFEVPAGKNLILYVPMTWGRYCFRGFNQSFVLAKIFEGLGYGEVRSYLKRNEFSKSSSLMSRQERFDSLEDVFELKCDKRELKLWDNFLIVDDVLTTGATFQAIENLLIGSGIDRQKIFKYALATGRLKD